MASALPGLVTTFGNTDVTYTYAAGPPAESRRGGEFFVQAGSYVDVNFFTQEFTGVDILLQSGGGNTFHLDTIQGGTSSFLDDFTEATGTCSNGSGSCAGTGTTITGVVEGTFVGNNAEGMIGGVGINVDGTPGAVSGVGYFER